MIFSGKVVAITGAAGGIGQSLCKRFAAEGAAIAALDKSDTLAAFMAVDWARNAKTAHSIIDVGDRKGVAEAFAKLSQALGPVSVLVNNAGFSSHPTFSRTDPESWQYELNGNLNSAYFCAHAVIEGMKANGGGSIVAIGSVNGLGALGDPAYSAAKAGMISLTKSLALEYGRYNIRSNIVLPGTVRTPLWKIRAAKDPSVLETLRKWYPLGRIVDPEDVANAVAFLASDAAAAISGAALPVDCGLTAGNIVMARELTLENF
jgi:NAD(P)-dependent dehydrogenase (short-subunit alcohol dehydrogenase family)